MTRLWALLQDAFLFWRGRVAALLLLLCVAVALWASDPEFAHLRPGSAAGPAVPMVSVPFASVRQWLFDSYQRVFPRERRQQPVVVVEIDEKSLEAQGQWPWPRNRLAQLVDAIAARQPAAIGLDIYMPEPDETSPDRVARNLAPGRPAQLNALAEALKHLPSHDYTLAQSLASAPTVLGVAGFDYQAQTSSEGVASVPLRVQGGDPRPWLRRYPRVLASLPELQRAARGKAVLSVSGEDPVIRRVLLVAAVAELVMPSLAMEMLRVASANPTVDLTVGPRGIESLGVGDFSVATQSTGDVWLHYARYADGFTRRISAADVLAGKVPDGLLTQKLVLVGLTGSGLSDRRVTALRELVPGVEIQAQVLESFFEGRFLLRPWWMKGAELALLLCIGALMIWLVPQARRRFAGEDSGERRRWGWVVMGLSALLLACGYALFRVQGWLFDAASLVAGLTCLAACLASSSILEIERDNLRLGRERERLREQAARVAGELEAARRIQLGSLPDAKKAFPGEQRFQIATLMQPAREVGGDLYDFFLIDQRRLCFFVGDVSGKGLPASLFMTVTKTLTRSIAMHMAGGPELVVAAASHDLSRENSEMLFVTLLLGVLDLETGELELVNAGHEAPWCIRTGGRVEQWPAPPEAGGPPLCVIDGFAYKSHRARLGAGDTVCFITDGISEAMDSAGAFYGNARLRAVLASLPQGETVDGITERIRDDVAGFVGQAEPSDDVALVVLRWGNAGQGPAS
ncbi:MAG TPA: CHASE2 domain-containing protein [Burkholderiaceae bacterium]|nr:CHASE2 domain-containing protein [Burkholderiaceae bacterium]